MEALAVEVQPFGIRVVLIEPGAILTPIVGKAGFPNMESPYAPIYGRFGQVAMHDFGRGSHADVVADCIVESITCESPRLRWPIGQGAERNLSTRAAMSDEEWVELWNVADDADFKQRMLGAEA
jgi:NAD(P)-dependent dehydrogenase (short-subunit alcohol dehydrogenase family)